MATYAELYAQRDNDDLRQRIEMALIIKAQTFLDGASTAEQRAWAKYVFQDGGHGESVRMLKYLLAKNKGSTVNQIQSVTDAALTTQIDAVAPAFVSAFVGG